jgi:hypothetical protein
VRADEIPALRLPARGRHAHEIGDLAAEEGIGPPLDREPGRLELGANIGLGTGERIAEARCPGADFTRQLPDVPP